VTTTVRVEGVKQTLNELRSIDPELRKTFNKNARQVTRPLVQSAQAAYQSTDFPSGTSRLWTQRGRPVFPLLGRLAVRGVSTKISTSKKSAGAIVVVQSNAGAAIFEFARNGLLGQAFTMKNGAPARVMWKAADQTLPAVQTEMTRLVNDVAQTVERRLY
jgi:hypothetical protein